jgi:hypothetical protein
MRRTVVFFAALLLAVLPLSLKPSVAFAANCLGRAATVVPVAGVYTLSAGNDVVVGTSAGDTVVTEGDGTGGTDYICTGGGNDSITIDIAGSATIRTGSGNDQLFLNDAAVNATVDVELGNGDDFVRTNNLGGRVSGGNGRDSLWPQGDDFVIPGMTVDAGPSNDFIQSATADIIKSGSGVDTVIDQSTAGATLVDCGSGRPDVFYAPNATKVKSCEADF